MASSGFDSTYLLWKNLKEGNKVIPLYIDTNLNLKQKELEIKNLKIICHYFSDKFNFFNIDSWPKIVKVDVDKSKGVPLQLPQVWIYGAYIYLHSIDIKINEIQLGYIMNDDALSYLDEIKNLWKAFNLFQKGWEPVTAKITFPIIKYPKNYLIEIASDEYPEIFHKIHFCEKPLKNDSNCKSCPSCEKAYKSGYELFSSRAERNRNFEYKFPDKDKNDFILKNKEKVIENKENDVELTRNLVGEKLGEKLS